VLRVSGLAAKLLFVLIPACDNQTQPVPPPTPADVQTIIRSNVQHENGLLLVRDTFLRTVAVMPANIPWAVKCGFGLRVFFGRDGETSTELRISHGFIPYEICRELASLAGQEISSITLTAGVRGRSDR
jgi:hypothetical protein